MEAAKWTKGPWSFVVEDGDRKIVAPSTDERLRTRDTLMCDTAYYPWCPDSDADWHLISAAPDLLEALQGALKALDAIGDEMTVGDRFTNAGQYLIDALMPARAAISKALGGEQQ